MVKRHQSSQNTALFEFGPDSKAYDLVIGEPSPSALILAKKKGEIVTLD